MNELLREPDVKACRKTEGDRRSVGKRDITDHVRVARRDSIRFAKPKSVEEVEFVVELDTGAVLITPSQKQRIEDAVHRLTVALHFICRPEHADHHADSGIVSGLRDLRYEPIAAGLRHDIQATGIERLHRGLGENHQIGVVLCCPRDSHLHRVQILFNRS